MAEQKIKRVVGFEIRLDKKLGEGSYGKVYLAYNPMTREEIACKITKFANKKEMLEVQAEIDILEKLKSLDGVIKYYGSWIDQDAGDAYLFMQHMDETFEEFLQEPINKTEPQELAGIKCEGRLPEKEALFYFYQLMKALKSIHSVGLMHRDLKPDNLFLKGNKLYLGDFNLSKFAEMTTSIVGTPKYMCPLIIIDRNGGFGKYVDLWSAGHILYRTLVGVHCYDYMCVQRRMRSVPEYIRVMATKVEEQGILFPSEIKISNGTRDLIKKLLSVNGIKDVTATEILNEPIFAGFRIDDEKSMRTSSNSKLMVQSMLTRSITYVGASDLDSKLKWAKKLFEAQSGRIEYLQDLKSRIDEFLTAMAEHTAEDPKAASRYAELLVHTRFFGALLLAMLHFYCKDFLNSTSSFATFKAHSDSQKAQYTETEFHQVVGALEEDIETLKHPIASNIPVLEKSFHTVLEKEGKSFTKKELTLLQVGIKASSGVAGPFLSNSRIALGSYNTNLASTYPQFEKGNQQLAIYSCYISELIRRYIEYDSQSLSFPNWSRILTRAVQTDLQVLQNAINLQSKMKVSAKTINTDNSESSLLYYAICAVLILGILWILKLLATN